MLLTLRLGARLAGAPSLPRTCLALVLLLIAAVIIGWRWLPVEERLFFQPKPDLVGTPAERGLPYSEVWFGPAGDLHGWYLPGQRDVTILWLHGNGGNISHRLDLLERLHRSLGASFFLFDYHGYGRSGGSPSEATIYADARAALAYLRSRPETADDRIVYFGKSLGTAVAAQLALEAPPDRLVLQSGFTSIPELARWYVPVLPLGQLLRLRFPTLDRLEQIQAPLLLVHGDADTVVPAEHSRLLYHAAGGPKCLLLVPGAGHENVAALGGQRYLDLFQQFAGPDPLSPDRCAPVRPDLAGAG